MSTIFSLPTLYNTTIGTNRSKQWSISVIDNGDETFTIHTEHGVTGGKQVCHDTLIVEGKNKGKKNETTPQKQAILEAERDWAKKVKQGYRETQQQQQQTQTQTQQQQQTNEGKKTKSEQLLKPMLANEFDMDKDKSLSFPVFIQPKLDGVRCLIYKNNEGKIVFQSRQNTIYDDFDHLVQQLEHLMSQFLDQDGLVLDGELYTHGMPFEQITSMVRSSKGKRKNIETLCYHVYDCFYSGDVNLSKNLMPYCERYQVLKSAFGNTMYPKLVLVETNVANSKKDIEDFHTYYTTHLENAYEGVMIRTPNGTYKQQGRSKDLQKYKKFMDEEFEVIGHHEGTGAHSGTPIFECKSNVNKDKTFSVTMQGTLENKRKMMGNVTDYYGKMLIVKYQEKSKEGIPRFPVGIGFRDYE